MPKFTDSLIGENLEVATEYFKSYMASANSGKKGKTSGGSIGFIPFNFSFTMDGISGIKIYNELALNTSFLPSGYTKTLDFVVTGVDHKLKDGDWETDVKVTLIPKTDTIDEVITGSLSVKAQKESYTAPPPSTPTTPTGPGSGSPIISNKGLKEVLISAGYTPGTFKFELALIMGTKEGYVKGSTTRPTRNNNPGNLQGSAFTDIDPGVVLEPPGGDGKRTYAKFTTPELGAKALVEKKIIKWAKGGYPNTVVGANASAALTSEQQKSWGVKTAGEYRTKFGVPSTLNGIAGKSVNMTIEQFMYIYAPPHENNTEGYITSIIKNLKGKYPTITRTSKMIDFVYL